ncbi:restriction endonuclease subunit S [Oscillospiraceae bacterium OttesenSCG-928-G22]|nr:restriction endonuclease subunit S [Oscillospiraceae bacterium OttesenSCG-928-G22]
MLKPYGEYRDFDELWLTTVPTHWEERKLKYLFSERVEKGYPNEPLLVASQNMGVVPKNVYGNRTVEATKDLHLLKLVKNEDFVISLRSFQGGIEYAYYRGIISPAYTVMTSLGDITPGYFRFFAKSKLFIELLKLCVTGIREGQNIDYSKLRNHILPIPPRDEQDQIVRYLDWKVSQINKLINAKKKQIALLQEQKQAIINQAVTKGLNPNVELKDSGIDYIDLIPKHWKVLQNRRLYKENARAFSGDEAVLSLSQKDGLILYENMKERSLHTASYVNWKLVHPNDLVLNRFKAHLGVFFSSTYRGIVTFHYGVFEPKISLNSKYYEALYHTPIYRNVYAGRSNGMTVGLQNLSNTNFYGVYTVFPPHNEQDEIVEEIEKIETQTTGLKSKFEDEVALLHEYRTRLISDVVTGQIDVRDVEIPEYEAAEEIIEDNDLSDDEILETEE